MKHEDAVLDLAGSRRRTIAVWIVSAHFGPSASHLEGNPNPTNPISGQRVLDWLREELAKAQYQSTEPDSEDWDRHIDVQGGSGS